MKTFKKVAIANRGEVAVRIIRACEELGIETVLLHSEPDRQSRAFRLATTAVSIGGGPASESYLNIKNVVEAARSAGADALHPGFGFLSENADFAEAVSARGMTFIGPTPKAIRTMGDKISARAVMMGANVPVVPGYQGDDQTPETLLKEATRIGFPLIIKAAAGGGGRGMKVVRKKEELSEQLESAKREAMSSFGSDQVFMERYIENAKHIEFQVFGDTFGNVVHLFERECSVQRRHQKIVEEAPSPSLSLEMREKMGAAAVAAARSAKYVGAGTVEFLLAGDEFFFLEMNTRLQVEHPVTELVCGVDLVKAQILVAQGFGLPWLQHEISVRGHAIECRLYAENPYSGGLPSTGLLGSTFFPEGPGRRYEVGFEKGDEITSFYDPMIAKVIVWDQNRPHAIQKMAHVLSESIVFGVRTNIPFLKSIILHPQFTSGRMNIQFIQTYFPNGLKAEVSGEPDLSDIERAFAEKCLSEISESNVGSSENPGTSLSPWSQGWRL